MWQGHSRGGDGRSSSGLLAREPPLRPISFLLLGFLVILGGEGRKPRRSFRRGLENLVQVLWVLGRFLEGGLGVLTRTSLPQAHQGLRCNFTSPGWTILKAPCPVPTR